MEICDKEVTLMAESGLFKQFVAALDKTKGLLNHLIKYKSNSYYKAQLDKTFSELNRTYKYLKAGIEKTENGDLKEQFKTVDQTVQVILSNSTYEAKLKAIKELEINLPDVEIELGHSVTLSESFKIPKEIPITEYRLDLEEAIKSYDNGCYVAALVLCRRSYEGALVIKYREKARKEPTTVIKCPHCKQTIKDNAYMGIAKLHQWAIDQRFVTEKMKQIGFLLADIGAGAAHPPLLEFPRDKELATLGINATMALLKELNSNR